MTKSSDSSLPHVGSAELVDLPEQGLAGVPAKVDTGADSSAIWASSITEQDHELSFVLFDQKSPFYSGQVMTTRQYSVISVKNSFGQTEFRYKVVLKVKLAGRTIRARFTLANRSTNRFPMLIGRKTLHGKFLVDVTKRADQAPKRVLILTGDRLDTVGRLAERLTAADEPNLVVDYYTYNDFIFYFGGTRCRIELADSGQDIAEYDLVSFKSRGRYSDLASAMAQYLDWRGIPFVNSGVRGLAYGCKLFQYVLFERSELLPPTAIFMSAERLANSYALLSEQLGAPFVLKDSRAHGGNNNFLIDSQSSFRAACRQTAADQRFMIAQKFIPNDFDYRVLVFENQVELIIRRHRQNGTHLNNTSKGAQPSVVPPAELPPAVLKNCLDIARLVGCDIAGVDLVQDKTDGSWYCFEVNDSPQLASGGFEREKRQAFAKYLNKKLG